MRKRVCSLFKASYHTHCRKDRFTPSLFVLHGLVARSSNQSNDCDILIPKPWFCVRCDSLDCKGRAAGGILILAALAPFDLGHV